MTGYQKRYSSEKWYSAMRREQSEEYLKDLGKRHNHLSHEPCTERCPAFPKKKERL